MGPAVAMSADVDHERARFNLDLVCTQVDEHVERACLRHGQRIKPVLARHEAEIQPADARGRGMQHVKAVPPSLTTPADEGGLGESSQQRDAVRPDESAGTDNHHGLRRVFRRSIPRLRERLRSSAQVIVFVTQIGFGADDAYRRAAPEPALADARVEDGRLVTRAGAND
jgi:hypothetical protein